MMLTRSSTRFDRAIASAPLVVAAGIAAILLMAVLSSCTDADVYAIDGADPNPPDRLIVRGEVCTEDPASSDFPAKVLFVVDQSDRIGRFDPDGRRLGVGSSGALGNITQTVESLKHLKHVRFGFISVADTARAAPLAGGQLFRKGTEPEVSAAISELSTPRSQQLKVSDAISQLGKYIHSDLDLSSPGEVVRSRYLVSLLFAGPPDNNFTPKQFGDQVAAIVDQIYDRGVMELQINVGLLYSGDLALQDRSSGGYGCYFADPGQPSCLCGGASGPANFCTVHCAVNSAGAGTLNTEMNRSRGVYEAIAFAGGGQFREFTCPGLIDMGIDVGRSGVELVRKDIVAFNRNVILGHDGQLVDSDGDGLPDIHETGATVPTDPLNYDTDGDGVGDRVEIESQKDPHNPLDRPGSCLDPAPLGGVLPDRDFDKLNDCEEGLLQSKATVPDSDGDGLPDFLEVRNSLLPGNSVDRLLDYDLDGVLNAREALEHTDPYSNEGMLRGEESYHNVIVPLGSRIVSSIKDSDELRGLVFRRASADLQPGQAFMEWDGCSQTLRWSDAGYFGGGRRYEPRTLTVDGSGVHTTVAAAANGDEIWAEWLINPQQMPQCSDGVIESFPLISSANRNCYDVTISNIKLMETERAFVDSPLPDERPRAGTNSIFIFFTQAPSTRLASPGVAKVAEVHAHFECTDPAELASCLRVPQSGEITLTDDMFVTALPARL